MLKAAVLVFSALAAMMAPTEAAPTWDKLSFGSYTYEQWIAEFKPESLLFASPAEHAERKAIFEANMREIIAHNRGPSTYKKGVNAFTAMTDEEFAASLGFDKVNQRTMSTLMSHRDEDLVASKQHPSEVDWTKRVFINTFNQGKCGSCWAHSAAVTVNAMAQISQGVAVNISRQAVVDCFENVRKCGGTGGCEGATAQLAFGWIKENGIPFESDYPYVSGETTKAGVCRAQEFPTSVTLDGWFNLKPNSVDDMMDVLSTYGPVAISVGANGIKSYESGVYDTCSTADKKVIINHAVTLTGYGYDAKLGTNYWTIKNSWGPNWGEDGSIRVLRAADGAKEECYIDDDIYSGSACEDDPNVPYTVCGCIGLLSDSAVPYGVKVVRRP